MEDRFQCKKIQINKEKQTKIQGMGEHLVQIEVQLLGIQSPVTDTFLVTNSDNPTTYVVPEILQSYGIYPLLTHHQLSVILQS